ncbi:MAG: hypothetical protein OEX07_05075 [Gammaproteobacteria bacterium]|nr:hypothetical protein [Gammaproteobacteria bacterium]
MRYLLLFLVYFVISLVLLLSILFPERLSSPLDFFILTLYFVPCVGTFDVLAQRLMDNARFSNLPQFVKIIFGIISLGVFIFALDILVDLVGMNTEPW